MIFHRRLPAVLGLLLAACQAPVLPPPPPARHPGPEAVRRCLEARHRVIDLSWPGRQEWPAVEVLVFDLRSRAMPDWGGEAADRAVRAWVEEGGALLLLGYAPLWGARLGLGLPMPDQVFLFRHGVDDATVSGTYEWGLAGEPGCPLLAGLEAPALLGGGSPMRLEIAGWSQPPAGTVASIHRVRDGEARRLDLAAGWAGRAGKGKVLALGVGLEPRGNYADACTRLLENAVQLLAGKPGAAVLGWLPGRDPSPESDEWILPPAPDEPPAARWWEAELPPAPELAHWGARLRLAGWADRPLDPDAARGRQLERLWGLGADTLELDPWGPGYPFDVKDSPWTSEAWREAAAAAHRLGMFVSLHLEEPLVEGWESRDGALALRRSALELFRDRLDRRLLGPEGALDGAGIGWWPADGKGWLQGLLWRFHPGAFVHFLAQPHAATPSSTAALNAQFGRVPGIEAGGLARGWRWDQHPPLYLACAADARLRPAGGPDPGRIKAGRGAWPDWLAAQAADFARPRLGTESLLLWLGLDPERQHAGIEPLIAGLGAHPVGGAFAFRLSATGRGGWREQARRWEPSAQAGFGAHEDQPCRATVLQNGILRLLVANGPLLFDPAGRGGFPRLGETVRPGRVLSAGFLRAATRSEPALGPWAFVFSGPFAGGTYGEKAIVELAPGAATPVPARLGIGPGLPARLEFLAPAPPGRYRFRLTAKSLEPRGMLRLEDGAGPVAFQAFRSAGEALILEGELAHPVDGHLEAAVVVEQSSLEIESLALERIGDSAAVAFVLEHGGPRSAVEERAWSPWLAERRRWALHAGFPGLALEVVVDRVEKGAKVEHQFFLTGYDRLLRGAAITSEAAEHGRVEGPWVLRDSRGELPDLAAVLLDRSPRLRLFWRPGHGLSLEGEPETGERFSIGFYLPRGEIPAERFHLLRDVLLELLEPPALLLEPGREAELVHPWPFPMARVVELPGFPGGRVLARERGWWAARSAVPASGGKSAFLLVHAWPGAAPGLRAGRRPLLLGPAGLMPGALAPPALPGGFRPGRGSEGLLFLRPAGQEVEVAVHTAGPFAFAPSVTPGREVKGALLDGRPWAYFDAGEVYLPRRPGRFRLQAVTVGEPAPHLAATSALVEACSWDAAAAILEIHIAHPPWFRGPLPESAAYHLLVRTEGRTLARVTGAEVVPDEELALPEARRAQARVSGALLRAGPGVVRVFFQ